MKEILLTGEGIWTAGDRRGWIILTLSTFYIE